MMEIDSGIFDEIEVHENCTVQVLTNSVTGEQSIGWWHTKQPPKDVSRCPICGGRLSEIRTQGGRRWRHCFSCHLEQEI